MGILKSLLFWRKKKPSKPILRFKDGRLITIVHSNTEDPMLQAANNQMLAVWKGANGHRCPLTGMIDPFGIL